jgi:S1-C subfamily serine protease
MSILRVLRMGVLVYAIAASSVSAQTPAQDSAAANDLFQSGPAGVAHKNLKFMRIVLRIPSEEAVGAVYSDLMCLVDSQPIYVKHSGDMNVEEFAPIFSDAVSQANHQDTASDSLFDGSNGHEPDLWVAAAVTGLKIRACPIPDILGRNEKVQANVSATIEWQVMDALERKIVFRATTDAQASVTANYRLVNQTALRAVFGNASVALSRMPEFQAITVSAPSAVNEAPPASTAIASVPLSTAPFTQNLKDIQAHVVTVITGSGTGSGFYISDNLLLTNHHVAPQGNPVKIRFSTGREIPGQVLISNARRDIALIQTESIGTPGLPLHLERPDVGSRVYVIGSPLGREFEGSVASGIVSAMREHNHLPFIQSDAGVTHGNSGGPMFDEKGNVVAITDLGIGGVNGEPTAVNLFIPIAEALPPLGVTVLPPVARKGGTKHAAAH